MLESVVSMAPKTNPSVRRRRIIHLLVAWIPGACVSAILVLAMGWVSLIFILPALWASWNYLRRGSCGFAEALRVALPPVTLPAGRADPIQDRAHPPEERDAVPHIVVVAADPLQGVPLVQVESGLSPPFTPPDWLNTLMRRMLETSGVQRVVGRSTALITFTGRRSGRIITTPVTYSRDGHRVIMSAHRARQWWRNLADHPTVELRLAGRRAVGTAQILTGRDAFDAYAVLLRKHPAMARAANVGFDRGVPDPAQMRTALQGTVVVVVNLAAESAVRSH